MKAVTGNAMRTSVGDSDRAPLIISFGTRWSWSALVPAFFSLGKDCWVAGWNHERVWMLGRRGNLLVLLGVEPRFLGRPAGSAVTMPLRFPRPQYIYYVFKVNVCIGSFEL
jgi:hypothetical protein